MLLLQNQLLSDESEDICKPVRNAEENKKKKMIWVEEEEKQIREMAAETRSHVSFCAKY